MFFVFLFTILKNILGLSIKWNIHFRSYSNVSYGKLKINFIGETGVATQLALIFKKEEVWLKKMKQKSIIINIIM